MNSRRTQIAVYLLRARRLLAEPDRVRPVLRLIPVVDPSPLHTVLTRMADKLHADLAIDEKSPPADSRWM